MRTDERCNGAPQPDIPALMRGTRPFAELPSAAIMGLQGRDGRRRWQRLAGDRAPIGCIGTLTVATRGSAGPGEVQVQIRGGTEAFIAWSPEPLPRGTSVLVIESRGHRAVDVSTWDDPLAGFQVEMDT
jgi:hypothetical protein